MSKECELCHYSFFKDVGFRFKEHVCNECHDLLMTGYELKNIAILNVKGGLLLIVFCGVLVRMRLLRDENWLNNSVLQDKGVL